MIKNNEWGAVAYLSNSRYGKNDEVTINSNSSYYTGGGSGNAYVNNGAQSTTGNVYGIYDMSGGAFEYVAAYVNNGNNSLLNYGASLVNGEAKTKNVYNVGSLDNDTDNYNQNAGVYGDAIYETSINGNSSNGSWYTDFSSFQYSGIPFFIRGGYYSHNTSAGMFAFGDNVNGNASNYHSFRLVLI